MRSFLGVFLSASLFVGCSSAGEGPDLGGDQTRDSGHDPGTDTGEAPGTDTGDDPGTDTDATTTADAKEEADTGRGTEDSGTSGTTDSSTGTTDSSTGTTDSSTGTMDSGDSGATKDSGSGGTKDSGTTPKDSGSSTPPADSGTGAHLANGVSITKVAVLQGVQVPVEQSGSKVSSRNADVVAGRGALIRVFVSPKSGFSAHAIQGKLELHSASGTLSYAATFTPSGSSSDATLASTMNFDVPTGAIATDTSYSVTLYDSTSSGGDTSGARYPATGTESLGARSTGETLKIVIVPIAYGADGSGRLPDTSGAQIEVYRKAFYGMYPAKSVQVTVREPYSFSGAIAADGSGFSNALFAMQKLRASDGVAKDVYYYGAFQPASSWSSYCGGGCVTGLCGLSSSPSDSSVRACVGIGYTGYYSAETAVHEVGHAHGRRHSPCGGPSDVDPSYPYSGGSIGSYGYDLGTKSLFSPSTYTDVMSYCKSLWVSDYTYQGLLERMAYVSSGASEALPFSEPQKYRYVQVAEDGALSFGDSIVLGEPPQGESRAVTWEAGDGKLVASVTGAFYPYDHLGGGYILVREPPSSIKALHIGGTRLARPAMGY